MLLTNVVMAPSLWCTAAELWSRQLSTPGTMYKINIFKRWWKNSPPPSFFHFSLVLLVSSIHPVTHLCNNQRDGLVWGPKVKDLEPVAWEGEGGFSGPKLSTPSALLCPPFILGVSDLRLLFLLCSLNVHVLLIALFYSIQGPFHTLTHSTAQAACEVIIMSHIL